MPIENWKNLVDPMGFLDSVFLFECFSIYDLGVSFFRSSEIFSKTRRFTIRFCTGLDRACITTEKGRK